MGSKLKHKGKKLFPCLDTRDKLDSTDYIPVHYSELELTREGRSTRHMLARSRARGYDLQYSSCLTPISSIFLPNYVMFNFENRYMARSTCLLHLLLYSRLLSWNSVKKHFGTISDICQWKSKANFEIMHFAPYTAIRAFTAWNSLTHSWH